MDQPTELTTLARDKALSPPSGYPTELEGEHTVTRLLLVDDHPVLRAGIKVLLSAEQDIEVVAEADDGVQAVRLAREHQIDVIVMDVALPQLTGVEATKEILAVDNKQRVLVLSAHEDLNVARQLLDLGAAGYALKRSTCEELVRAVRVVASGGIYLDPTLAHALTPRGRGPRPSSRPTLTLSEREAEVVRLIARGHSSKEMAEQLGLSPRTLETYKGRAMAKLDARTKADLINYAVLCGWMRDP